MLNGFDGGHDDGLGDVGVARGSYVLATEDGWSGLTLFHIEIMVPESNLILKLRRVLWLPFLIGIDQVLLLHRTLARVIIFAANSLFHRASDVNSISSPLAGTFLSFGYSN